MSDGTEPVPSACDDGHASWPSMYIRLYGQGAYRPGSPMRTGSCPLCGKPRAILPGEYRAGPGGYVTRDGLPVTASACLPQHTQRDGSGPGHGSSA